MLRVPEVLRVLKVRVREVLALEVPEVPGVLEVLKVQVLEVLEVPKVLKVLSLFLFLILAGCSRPAEEPAPPTPDAGPVLAEETTGGGPSVILPKQVGPWVRGEGARRITADTIFDYMNGAGELYLAYRFDRLDVHEYRAADSTAGTIQVELYWMRSPDDAFGLLSTDWGGEDIPLNPGVAASSRVPAPGVPTARALYGGGLLRLASDALYARVLASRESPSSREQVLELARAIAAGRTSPPAPEIVGLLPPAAPGGYAPRPDRTVFFRSHLVLNSAYFLASEDILGLGPDVEGVTTEYVSSRPGGRPARLIVVRYPNQERVATALGTFRRLYLPETVGDDAGTASEGAARAEQGWVAYRSAGLVLAIALDVRDRDEARRLVARVAS